jgi:biofilm PGA synthesis N-glycosyltransferase PgaC
MTLNVQLRTEEGDRWKLPDLSFVLITPAKNEAARIQGTLESVIAQTVRPSRWIIVDDGSTDETAAIVQSYVQRYPFIGLLRLTQQTKREFSNKVTAFNSGQQALEESGYTFIGNLDADITLPPDYFEAVLDSFNRDTQLGIAGGRVNTTISGRFVCRDRTTDSVGGAVQLFRRKCFEEIGGYQQLPFGGIDAAAEITARWKGWSVRKVDKDVYEHRQTGSAQDNLWKQRYRDGMKFHTLGYGGIFFACKCLFRLMDKPVCIGSMLSIAGFVSARMRRVPLCMPREAVVYLRLEQKQKLWL